MKSHASLAWACLLIGAPAAASAQEADPAVRNQWFTGSLEASSPALGKAGVLAIEPYVIYQINTGIYDGSGNRRPVPHDVDHLLTVIVVKYALTDRLSVQALPSFDHISNDRGSSSGLGFGDLPLELEYRFKNENGRTGSPSITVSLGITLPTGDYQHLGNQLNGIGSGAYFAKQGLVVESLFDTQGGHPMRIKLFAAAYEPLATAPVRDVSVFGTEQGFRGRAKPGAFGQIGLAAGYAMSQRWVLAIDVVQNFAAGNRLTGTGAAGEAIAIQGPHRSATALAPALEYNWSANAGVIAGVEISVAGRNSTSYAAPQIALAISF